MTRARKLTPEGVRRAKVFLSELREDQTILPATPDDILNSPECSQPFLDAPDVHHTTLQTRRDAANYIASLRPEVGSNLSDDWAFWSWLGVYHLEDIITEERRHRVSAEHETFVIDTMAVRGSQDIYRNYLWTAWRIQQQFGEELSFLLDQELIGIGRIARLITNSTRVFNSPGVPKLMVHLYSDGKGTKRGLTVGPGNIDHLIRVLAQLERTYDVYGMELEALLKVLPPDFDRWRGVQSPLS